MLVLAGCLAIISRGGSGPSQGTVDVELERIYQDYLAMSGRPDAARLVDLDRQIRRLVPYWNWQGPPAKNKNYREEYETIGVRHALFEPEALAYSGKLLFEAHRLDSKSHRSHTLYATVFGGAEADVDPPSASAAKAYLKEFPTGPFAIDAHLAVAHFYSDLFNVIRAEEAGSSRDYKYDCYKAFIAAGPLGPQRRYAHDQVLEHYGAVLRLRPQLSDVSEWLAEFRRNPGYSWHYCAD